jgi:DNA-directed RNA polymerase specialized sigma24 family protein
MTTKREDSADLCELARLLERMRAGDRGAAAHFLTRYGSRIRRRVRSQITRIRRIYDSEEILATTGRRLDQFVRRKRLRATSEQQLWKLVFRIANNAVVDKARTFNRFQHVESGDGPFAHLVGSRLRSAEQGRREMIPDIEWAFEVLRDPLDQTILRHRQLGADNEAIAARVGLTREAVWKRWERIRSKLQTHLAREGNA